MTNNEIGYRGVKALAANTTLTSLIIECNNIGSLGAEVLATNATIRELCLAENSIGERGAKALATNSTITSLNIGSNHLNAEAAKALAANSTITALNIGRNYISTEGAKALAANSTITALNIRNNIIGSKGVLMLLKNNQFTTLNICGINIYRNDINSFINNFKNNFTLTKLLYDFRLQGVNEKITKILTRNKFIQSYPQYTKLILALYAKIGLSKKYLTITPLPLNILCALTFVNTMAKQPKQLQQKVSYELSQTMPIEVNSLLNDLRELSVQLKILLKIATLPHYGIDEVSELLKRKEKKHKNY